MVAVAKQKKIRHDDGLREETNVERLLRLSEEAARGKLVDVTDLSDDDFFKIISRK